MKCALFTLAGTLLTACTGSAEPPLAVGDSAPALKAMNQDGDTVDLGEIYAKGTTLVYFYPKADTPGCTAQSCSLRDAYEELTDEGVTVIGVSTDSVASQKAFAEKYKLPFMLLADTEKKVLKGFRVPSRMGFASRQAFLIRDGKVVWLDTSASTRKQAEDALKALRALE